MAIERYVGKQAAAVWTREGKLQREFDASIRELEANHQLAMAKIQSEAAQHMVAMMGAMNLFDAGMAIAREDQTKQMITLQYTDMYMNGNRQRFQRS